MNDTYTPDEFAKSCALRGYCKAKAALEWLSENGMTSAVEFDFERCYYDLNRQAILPHRSPYIAMTSSGFNFADPENASNSRGMTYAQQMRRIQRENDRIDAYIRQKMEGANELN